MPGSRSSSRSASLSSRSSGEHASEPSRTPLLRSSSALVLIPDTENEDDSDSFPFSDEDDESPFATDTNKASTVTPLPPPVIFLYFLSPCLKLGAMLIFNGSLPLKFAIPSLVVFSFLSAFASQIWFLLARYVRKPDLADIISEALARGRRKEGRRKVIKAVVQSGSDFLRVLLVTVYLRESVDLVLLHVPEEIAFVPSRIVLCAAFSVFLSPLSLASSLASKRLVYATWISIALYILWISAVAFAYAKGMLGEEAIFASPGKLWHDISIIAFTFTSANTLHLYASLIGVSSPGSTKEKRFQSITSMSLLATILGMLMVLPLVFLQGTSSNHDDSESDLAMSMQAMIATLASITLLLAIPPFLVTAPALPIPTIRQWSKLSVSKLCLLTVSSLLSILPAKAMSVLCDVLIVTALSSTYFIPALIHIIHHHLRRPLSIVIPPRTPNPQASPPSTTRDAGTDELLRRKEQALQRRRVGRRILWDIGVWVLLIPIGGGGFAWAVGRLARKW